MDARAALGQEPGSLDVVVSGAELLDEPWRLSRIVLPVRREHDDRAVTVRTSRLYTRSDGGTDPPAPVLGDHPGAGLAREVWPAIVGSVVNDDRLRDGGRDAADERGDRVTLVEQRKDHRDGPDVGHDGTLPGARVSGSDPSRADRVGELAAGDLLQEVSRRARADRAEYELVLVVVREDDHARRRYGVAHAPRGRDPVPVAHLYVHEDHVGQKLLRHRERLVSVAGLADDLYLGLGLEY